MSKIVGRSLKLWVGVLIFLALGVTIAYAADGEHVPVLEDGEGAADVLWVTLAPILAIATFAERMLEVFWDRWEAPGVWPNRRGVVDTSSPPYIAWKRLRSHWLGTVIAIVAIGLTNVRFFRLLGLDILFSSPRFLLFHAGVGGIFDNFTVGTLIDWILTAWIIGWGGTELTHGVIEALIKGRNLWKEMREVEAGERMITEARFFNDYIAPQLEKYGVSVASLRSTLRTLRECGVPVDEFISSLTVGKVDEILSRLEEQPEKAEAARAVRAFLEGVPASKQVEFPKVSTVLSLLTDQQRQRFLGA
ncbi:MAG: hypothetical protein N2508_01550 [Anaerolineae bacterium]|nr:hypothetical protein [Anaerolineae bacterium]